MLCAEIRQGKPATMSEIGVKLGKMKVFFQFSLSVSLFCRHIQMIHRPTISFKYIPAGKHNICRSLYTVVHKYVNIMLNLETHPLM